MSEKDDGCELHNSCLNCPEPICIYDFPGYKKNWNKFKLVIQMHQEGATVEQIIRDTQVSRKYILKYISYMEIPVLV